ncbi:MAG: hypothetical protein KF855_17125 [Acidobacteria bacterium]|nr:hypothetical protein [Acidobacteriota bacterium]
MNPDLSNRVIARINGEIRDVPSRSLDLGNIRTPELGLLSPQRSEIAPRGEGRDAALIAYSERLRNSYKANEGGLRDGMLKLGEAFRDGQTINISCFCRAGEACHADVVKIAIEKVGNAIKAREANADRTQPPVNEHMTTITPNPRTERAIGEMLSVSRSEMLLAKLEDTEGRNRSEHASHLNGHSQFIRDLYERGATVRDGVLISPKENLSSAQPLAIATNEYAVKRLTMLLGESRAKELAPQIVAYGAGIAGSSADRDTKIKVFNWIYGALEGRNSLLTTEERTLGNESKEERVERTLKEIAGLAEEMGRLEPSDKLVQTNEENERTPAETHDRQDDELSLEKVYEDAISPDPEATSQDIQEVGLGLQEFERIELSDTTLSRLASEMSKQELDRWTEVRLPALDEALETGMPVDSILKIFQNNVYHATKDGPAEKQAAIDDLRFASAYIEHQLKQPESRLRHFNARYREYAGILEQATTREEVIDAASRIRLENAKIGFQWKELPDAEKAKTSPPLTSKEMRFLFTESSPRHYTSEMTAAKLSYMSVGDDARTKTDSLMRGEISPSVEAAQLIDSLESRLRRRHLKDSLSATKHFLQSLKTPNEELRYKNTFDHSDLYRKLPAAERDFVYQRAVLQKEGLESKLFDHDLRREKAVQDPVQKPDIKSFSEFREELKSEILKLVRTGTKLDHQELAERTALILDTSLARIGFTGKADRATVTALSRELSDGIEKAASYISMNHGSKLCENISLTR